MSFLDTFFNRKQDKKSSGIARERLQVLLAQEKDIAGKNGEADLLRTLHYEIIEVLSRHVPVDQDNVKVSLDKGSSVSRLEIDIQVPGSGLKAQVSAIKSN